MKIFESVQGKRPQYSAFDLSHERKMSMEMGILTPCYYQEILPGDHFKVKTETLLRMAPMIAPIMHRVNLYVHYFFVPNRIIWSQWPDFITGGQNGLATPTMPTLESDTSDAWNAGSLADYIGLPSAGGDDTNTIVVSALPFRAYQNIWQEYFRDETTVFELDVETATQTQLTQLRRRSWEKDYFTSCLPWAQRGPEVAVPMEMTPEYASQSAAQQATGVVSVVSELLQTPTDPVAVENLVDPQTDFNLNINDLRTSNALQRFLERNAVGGYRYIEQIRSHFGVRSSDARLQRPEYLGGGKQPVIISEVLNTSDTATAEQGAMSGHGITAGTTNSFKRKFEEHGCVMGIMSVIPKTAYQDGVPKQFQRFDKLDYFFPEFAHLGEQEVKVNELYHDYGTSGQGATTFGYQQRYAEYKYEPSTVHGDFRSNLDFWHLGRKFTAEPQLDSVFTNCTPSDRIFAAPAARNLWVQVYNRVQARRLMPYFSNPRL